MFAWLQVNKWAVYAGGILAAVLSWNVWIAQRDRRIKAERDVYWERRQAEERARMTQTATRIEQEHRTNADRAIEAGRTARPLTSDSMSDADFLAAFGFPRNNRKLDREGG